ncbi:MAG: hypothetical protein ACON5N_09835 [Akkermansiaceae bacterium]
MSDPNSHSAPRTAATGAIAGCSVGAFAISVIFGQVVNGGIYLPMTVILASALAISAVWIFGKPANTNGSSVEIEELSKRLSELEDRLQAAETIEAYEDRLATKEDALRIETESAKST